MKRWIAVLLAVAFVFGLSACAGGAEKLTGEYEGYYRVNEDGIVSVTNYHPYHFFDLPDYQELAEYGNGAGLDNEGVVYFIFITHTSKEDCFYSAEFDGATRELLSEEGTFFTDETAKKEAVDRLLNMLDTLKVDN
ncbi:MAG: hypothetical protein E7435_04995 [Ruminococcaceae bacterium]|nr:hypothetical protein [Oscillospiraceae bacterium]